METVRLRPGNFYLMLLILVGSIGFIEYGGLVENRGALLMTLVFWATLIQGMVAVVATTDLIGGKWTGSLKKELLACVPLLLLVLALYLLMLPQLGVYPWAGKPGAWLNPPFFIGRNLVLLVLSVLVAWRYSRHSLRQSPICKTYAILYLLVFVTSQSLVAFDWVMSLEYPWYSTLFGAYFFVESMYAGFALAGVVFFLFHQVKSDQNPERTERHLRDVGLLIFGFSVLWMGLFFAQFLLLWYGNLPEEVEFILRRISSSPFREMTVFFLVANFGVPFTVLISRRAKKSAGVVCVISLAVLSGLFIERLLFILPVVPLHVGALAAQNLLIAGAWMLTVHSRDELFAAPRDS